jgi:hypothetical protein
MKHSNRSIWVVLLLVVVWSGCGGSGSGGISGASTDTPSGTITLFMDALERGDVDAYIELLPLADRRRAEMSREAMGEQFDSSLKAAMASMQTAVAGGKVVGEEITGTRALVRVETRSGREVTWNCVKEPDGWRVAVQG